MPVRSVFMIAAIMALAIVNAAGQPRIIVSLHPYAVLVEQIVGDKAEVVQLLPSGASPHTFDPSPSQAISVATADLIVMNGGVNAWLDRLLRSSAPDKPVFTVIDALTFDPIGGAEHDAEEGTVDSHAEAVHGANAHVWLDPVLMAKLAPLLAEALGRVDPLNAEIYGANAAALASELMRLDTELQALLAPVRGAPFVPFHDAWPYFARRYGLNLVLSIEPFPGREPSARYVSDAVRSIRANGAKAVFSERQLSQRPAQVVAAAAGVGLAVLDPLGTDDQGYVALLRSNAAIVLEALRPTSPP